MVKNYQVLSDHVPELKISQSLRLSVSQSLNLSVSKSKNYLKRSLFIKSC